MPLQRRQLLKTTAVAAGLAAAITATLKET